MEILEFFNTVLRSSLGVVIVLLYVVALWFTFNLMTKFNDSEELFRKDNSAYMLQRLGLVAAQVIAMLAVLPGYNADRIWVSAGWLAFEGLWVFIALVLARWFVDWLLLPKINNTRLLQERNLGVGFAEAGAYIGIGILLAGSLTGSAETLWLSIASTVVFYVLGLLFVTAVFWLYELATPYKLRSLLQEGNVAAGIELAGVFVAAALAVRVGVSGDFEAWGSDLVWFLVTACASIVLLAVIWAASLLVSVVVWKIPRQQLRETPTITIALFRAGTMVLASVIAAAVLASS